jgi:FKBP-type peptidyl-prolyl cis-trans isomerase
MKRTILAAFLILTVGAFVSFAQTKKRTARGKSSSATATTKRAVVKKPAAATATTKKMTNSAAITTESGLTYIVTKRGDGAQLKAGDNVVVHYTGLLTNGQKFDSSLDRGEPFSFPLGAGRVIKGWDEGVQKLRVGDHATFIIPASIAYGSRGAGGVIPPDATLIFIIEVVGVK